MSNLLRFRGLEQLGEPGGVSIIAPTRSIKGNEPSIKIDHVQELLDNKIQVPYGIRFYSGKLINNGGDWDGPFSGFMRGFRMSLMKNLYIPIENPLGAQFTPMQKIIAAGLNAQSRRDNPFPIRYIGTETSAASAATVLAGELAGVSGLETAGAVGLTVFALGKATMFSFEHAQTNLHSYEITELRRTHDSDIVFPAQASYEYLDRA